METMQAQRWRWLVLFSAVLEVFMFGGLLFGWGSLVFVLKQDGVYSHLCTDADAKNDTSSSETLYINTSFVDWTEFVNNGSGDIKSTPPGIVIGSLGVANLSMMLNRAVTATAPLQVVGSYEHVTLSGWPTCAAQDDALSFCFSVSSAGLYCVTGIAGALSYKLGTRITRLIGTLSFVMGTLFIAFTSPDYPWLPFLGLTPLGFGGVVLIITDVQIGTLFKKGSSTVIAALIGLFDTSSVVMLFVKFAHESGISIRACFLCLCGLNLLTLGNTLFLRPRRNFDVKEYDDVGDGNDDVFEMSVSPPVNGTDTNSNKNNELENNIEQSVSLHEDRDAMEQSRLQPQARPRSKKEPTIRECLLSYVFIMELVWMSLLQLRFIFFLGSLNPWLSFLFKFQQEVSYYTNMWQYFMMVGFFVSVFCGATFDILKHIFSKQAVAERRRLYPVAIMLGMTSVLGVMFSVTVLVESAPVTYLTFIFAIFLRSFIYSVDANVFTIMFPVQYLVALFCISDSIGGAISMLQYALTVWYHAAGFATVNKAMLAMTVLTIIHPLVLFWRGVRAGKQEDHASCEIGMELSVSNACKPESTAMISDTHVA